LTSSARNRKNIDDIAGLLARSIAGVDLWLLLAIGFLVYTSLSVLKSEHTYTYFVKQTEFLWAGGALMVIMARIPYSFWVKPWVIPVIYLVNLGMLILVMIKGHSAQGAQRWLALGPLTLQPSEVSKVVVIFTIAAWFKHFPIRSFFDIFKTLLVIGPPAFLVFKQPDLGTSLTFGAMFLGTSFWMGATIADIIVLVSPVVSLVLSAYSMQYVFYFMAALGVFLLIFWRRNDMNWVLRIVLILAILGANYGVGWARPHLWGHLKEYQQKRLTSFVDPYSDPRGSGYHILQSLIAIGSGGVTGTGIGKGNQSQGAFIPERHTDFIFAVVGEELGFKICIFVVAAYAVICLRALAIAFRSRGDPVGSSMAIGIMCMFIFHAFINMGMTMGIMPVTGVPLPFLSYGGTALIIDLVCVGLLQSIYFYNPPEKKDPWGR